MIINPHLTVSPAQETLNIVDQMPPHVRDELELLPLAYRPAFIAHFAATSVIDPIVYPETVAVGAEMSPAEAARQDIPYHTVSGYVSTPLTCETGGCALLNLYDSNNDGKVTSADALRAQSDGRSIEEVQFILEASTRGSINAMCYGCYIPSEEEEEEEPDKKTSWMLYLVIAAIAFAMMIGG